MSTKDPAFNFRIPSDIRKQLNKEAKAEHRSLNSYLLTLLETHPDRAKARK